MDFTGRCGGLTRAADWFTELHERGEQCGSALGGPSSFTGSGGVPEEYRCAVAWHNLLRDDRLHPDQRQRILAEVIDEGRDRAGGASRLSLTDILDFWTRANARDERLESRFQSDLSAMGPAMPGSLSHSDEGYGTLCSLIRHRRPTESEAGALAGVWPLEPLLTRDAGPPIIWLARHADLKDALDGANTAEEALCRVGLENSVPSCSYYLLLVNADVIWHDLHVPTVADSRLWYMWAASGPKDGPTGMTRHTVDGRSGGVQEFVIRRERLREVYEDPSSSDAIRIAGEWPCGVVTISRDHAEKRWRDEIESVI